MHSARKDAVSDLVDRWEEFDGPENAPAALPIAEALSSRECTVVELIGQGRSNKEIARDLGIAPETVKSHVKNIFIKLAVQKRAQAVARARSLGLAGTRADH